MVLHWFVDPSHVFDDWQAKSAADEARWAVDVLGLEVASMRMYEMDRGFVTPYERRDALQREASWVHDQRRRAVEEAQRRAVEEEQRRAAEGRARAGAGVLLLLDA